MYVQRFKKLLVYIDPEAEAQPALRRAAQMAHSNGAALDVIEVMEEAPQYARGLMRQLHIDATAEAIKQESVKRLEALVAPLKTAGLQVNTFVATGTPFLEIIRTVLRHGHDLVLKTVVPERRWPRMFLSSTDMHLLRKCPSALWLINPAEPVRYQRILVALDPDMEDQAKRELGSRLLHMAISVARSESAELLLGHAWAPFAEKKFKSHVTPTEFSSYMRGCKRESTTRLQAFLAMAGVDDPPGKMLLAKGEASVVIPRLARRHAVDLVVMGTVGRSGIPGFLIGNTAERILNQLTCSILTIKPPGFVSPVL